MQLSTEEFRKACKDAYDEGVAVGMTITTCQQSEDVKSLEWQVDKANRDREACKSRLEAISYNLKKSGFDSSINACAKDKFDDLQGEITLLSDLIYHRGCFSLALDSALGIIVDKYRTKE